MEYKDTFYEIEEILLQNKKYHPEGNALNHVLLVVDETSEKKLGGI